VNGVLGQCVVPCVSPSACQFSSCAVESTHMQPVSHLGSPHNVMHSTSIYSNCPMCTFYYCTMTSTLIIVDDCPLLAITNGVVSYQQRTPPLVGTTATYEFNSGYTLHGNNLRVCQDVNNGTWTGSDASCNREYIMCKPCSCMRCD